MIHLDRERRHLIFSRCAYLYRSGTCDTEAEAAIGDGDIIVPLPDYFSSREHDPHSDGGSLELIVLAVQEALKQAIP